MRRSDLAGRAVWDSRRTTDGRLGSRVNKRRLSHPLVNPQFTASLQGLPLARSGLSGGLCELELGLGHADTEYAAPPASPPYGGGSASGNDGSSDGSGDGSGSSIGRVGSGSSTVSRGSGSADGDDGGGAGGDDVVMRPRKNSKTLPLAKMRAPHCDNKTVHCVGTRFTRARAQHTANTPRAAVRSPHGGLTGPRMRAGEALSRTLSPTLPQAPTLTPAPSPTQRRPRPPTAHHPPTATGRPTLIDASPSAELGEAAGRQFYGRQESLLADETLKRDGTEGPRCGAQVHISPHLRISPHASEA